MRSWFDSLYHARERIRDYFRIYNYRRRHRSLKRRTPYGYVKAFFPEFADRQPFAFSLSLSGVALDGEPDRVATCLALDKEGNENAIFARSENQNLLLN